MQLSEKQLKVQQRADKTLSFGCILLKRGSYGRVIDSDQVKVLCSYDNVYHNYSGSMFIFMSDIEHIIGHPMTRGRLCYLYVSYQGDSTEGTEEGEAMFKYADEYYDIYNQTILARPEEFIDLVIAFLETLPKNIDAQ